MSVFVSCTIVQFLHKFSGSVAQMKRHRQIAVFFYIGSRSERSTISDIVFFGLREIDSKLEQKDIAFRFAYFGNGVINLIGKEQSVIVCRSDILGSETQESPRKVQWILAGHQHSLDPIASRIAIAVTKRFVDSGDDVVMLLAVPVIIDAFLSCLQDNLFSDDSIFCKENS